MGKYENKVAVDPATQAKIEAEAAAKVNAEADAKAEREEQDKKRKRDIEEEVAIGRRVMSGEKPETVAKGSGCTEAEAKGFALKHRRAINAP